MRKAQPVLVVLIIYMSLRILGDAGPTAKALSGVELCWAPKPVFDVTIGVLNNSNPGVPFALECTTTTVIDTVVTGTVIIVLPDGVTTQSGLNSDSFAVAISSDHPSVNTVGLLAATAGLFEIRADLETEPAPGVYSGSHDLFYVNVTAGLPAAPPAGGRVVLDRIPDTTSAYYDFEDYITMAPYDTVASPGEGADSIYGGPAEPAQLLTVTGRYVYYDPENVLRPLVNATIHIWDSDNIWCGGDDHLGSGITDSDGR